MVKHGIAIFALLVFLFPCADPAGAKPTCWAKIYGEERDVKGRVILPAENGAFLVAGGNSSVGPEGPAWLLKIGPDGKTLWQKVYGNSTDGGVIVGADRTADGGVVMTGISSDVAGRRTAWTAKVDAAGKFEWQKRFGNGDSSEGNWIRQTGDGGYIMAGITGPEGYDRDAWVLKLTPSGAVEWEKRYGGPGEDGAFSIEPTADGGYIFAGTAYWYRAWVVKIDAKGVIQWQKSYGDGSEYGYAVRPTPDGGYILVGSTRRLEGTEICMWILKLDSEGTVAWQRAYGGSGIDECRSIELTSDNGYLLTGVTGPFGETPWVVKLDSAGVIDWQRTYYAWDKGAGTSIRETEDGGYVLTGSTRVTSSMSSLAVMKIGPHGEIPGCYAVWVASAVSREIEATESATDALAVETAAEISNLPVKETVTSEKEFEQCFFSSSIDLVTPEEDEILDDASHVNPPAFQWTAGESFKSFELQISPYLSFDRDVVKAKWHGDSTGGYLSTSAWMKALRSAGEEGGEMDWRVVGKRENGSFVASETRRFFVSPSRPVQSPVISPTSMGALPVLSWQVGLNTKFKVWFGTDPGFSAKKSFSFAVSWDENNHGLFQQILSSAQWTSVRKLAGDQPGRTLYWFVESWDIIKRRSQTDVMSFSLASGE
jgi:hypothetical protein